MKSSFSLTEILQEPPISIAIAAEEAAEAAVPVAVPISMAMVDDAAILIVVLPISMVADTTLNVNVKILLLDDNHSGKKQYPRARSVRICSTSMRSEAVTTVTAHKCGTRVFEVIIAGDNRRANEAFSRIDSTHVNRRFLDPVAKYLSA